MIRRLINFLFGKKPKPFLDHIAALFPLPEQQELLLKFMAHIVQYPNLRYGRALVLVAPRGSGKDTLLSVLRGAVPDNEIVVTDYQTVSGRFNHALANKSLVLVQCGSRVTDTLGEIKPLILMHRMEFTEKGKEREWGATPTNFIVVGDTIEIGGSTAVEEMYNEENRRFYYVVSPHTSSKKVRIAGSDPVKFVLWMGTAGNKELVTEFLRKYPV